MKTLFLSFGLLVFGLQTWAANPVDNFHQVSAGVYRGARPVDESEIQALKKFGIKTVVNLQGGDPNDDELGWLIPYVEEGETIEERTTEQAQSILNGLEYYNFPLNSLDRVTKREADKIAAALKVMVNPANQPVFVHCAHGADRTGLVIALYRVIFQNWSVNKAHAEMKQMGHNWIHQAFTHEMDEFLLDPRKIRYLKAKIQSGN